jgi:flagellar motor switch protein FliN/FliY
LIDGGGMDAGSAFATVIGQEGRGVHDLPSSTAICAPATSAADGVRSAFGRRDLDQAEATIEATFELGLALLPAAEVLALDRGSVVPLDCAADDPVNIYAGDRLFARAQPIVMDGRLCFRVSEILDAGGKP